MSAEYKRRIAHKNSDGHPRLFKTLSFRIVAVFSLVLAIALAMVTLLASITLRQYLTEDIDRNLRSSGRLMATLTIDQLINGSQTQVLPSDFYLYISYDGLSQLDSGTRTFEVVHNQVREVYGTPASPHTLTNDPNDTPHTVDGTKPGTHWRVITLDLNSSPTTLTTVGSVVIGLSTVPLENTVSQLAGVLAFVAIIVVILGAFSSFFMVRHSLTTLRDIETATQHVAAGDLSARVPTGVEGSEIAILGESINAMLARLEEAFAAQASSERSMRQFVSDASHELRTPLATIRGYAELYRLGGVPEDSVDLAFSRVESESQRMAHLVDDLLQLTRLGEGRKLVMQRVDLASIALNTVTDFEVSAPDRHAETIGLNGGEPSSVVVAADPDKVTQVIANLLANVSTHTPPGTPVEVAVGIDPAQPSAGIVEVRDHGPGIPAEDRARIFERFFRADSSRSRLSGGTGLGLSIVAAIMRVHDGTYEALETPGGGLTIRLGFPRVDPADDDAEPAAETSVAKRKISGSIPFLRKSKVSADSASPNTRPQDASEPPAPEPPAPPSSTGLADF